MGDVANRFVPPHDRSQSGGVCDCRTCLDAKIEWQASRIEQLTRMLFRSEEVFGQLAEHSERALDLHARQVHVVAELKEPDPPEPVRHDDPPAEFAEPDPVAFGVASRHGPK